MNEIPPITEARPARSRAATWSRVRRPSQAEPVRVKPAGGLDRLPAFSIAGTRGARSDSNPARSANVLIAESRCDPRRLRFSPDEMVSSGTFPRALAGVGERRAEGSVGPASFAGPLHPLPEWAWPTRDPRAHGPTAFTLASDRSSDVTLDDELLVACSQDVAFREPELQGFDPSEMRGLLVRGRREIGKVLSHNASARMRAHVCPEDALLAVWLFTNSDPPLGRMLNRLVRLCVASESRTSAPGASEESRSKSFSHGDARRRGSSVGFEGSSSQPHRRFACFEVFYHTLWFGLTRLGHILNNVPRGFRACRLDALPFSDIQSGTARLTRATLFGFTSCTTEPDSTLLEHDENATQSRTAEFAFEQSAAVNVSDFSADPSEHEIIVLPFSLVVHRGNDTNTFYVSMAGANVVPVVPRFLQTKVDALCDKAWRGDFSLVDQVDIALLWMPNSRASQTSLYCAARQGHVALVRKLLALAPSTLSVTSIRERNGSTPLHAAAFYGHVDVIELLLAAGADKSLRNRHGKTPVQEACGGVESPSDKRKLHAVVTKLLS